MENIFSAIKPVGNKTIARFNKDTLVKLKSLGKGTYEQTVQYLLGNNTDQKVINRINELEERSSRLEVIIEKLVHINKLRTY
jgi:hypothetical protein